MPGPHSPTLRRTESLDPRSPPNLLPTKLRDCNGQTLALPSEIFLRIDSHREDPAELDEDVGDVSGQAREHPIPLPCVLQPCRAPGWSAPPGPGVSSRLPGRATAEACCPCPLRAAASGCARCWSPTGPSGVTAVSPGRSTSSPRRTGEGPVIRPRWGWAFPGGGGVAWDTPLSCPAARFRVCCQRIVAHRLFDHVVLAFIFLNCITIALERPDIDPGSTVSGPSHPARLGGPCSPAHCPLPAGACLPQRLQLRLHGHLPG